jgi:hypothetical protein
MIKFPYIFWSEWAILGLDDTGIPNTQDNAQNAYWLCFQYIRQKLND